MPRYVTKKEERGKSAKPGNSSHPLPIPLPRNVAQNGQAAKEAISTQVKRSKSQPQTSRKRNAPTTTEPNLKELHNQSSLKPSNESHRYGMREEEDGSLGQSSSRLDCSVVRCSRGGSPKRSLNGLTRCHHKGNAMGVRHCYALSSACALTS